MTVTGEGQPTIELWTVGIDDSTTVYVGTTSERLPDLRAAVSAQGLDYSLVGGAVNDVLPLFYYLLAAVGAGGLPALIRALGAFLHDHEGKKVIARVGQDEKDTIIIEHYSRRDVEKLIRAAIDVRTERRGPED